MPDLSYDFRDRTIVVTGAAQGIGKAISAQFVEAGAKVWMIDVDHDLVGVAADEVGGIAATADVTDTDDVERVMAEAFGDSGRIDAIFNNAGLLRDRMVWKLSDADWHAVVDVSLGGTFRFTRAAIPYFRKAGYGRIVNVTSYTGIHGNVGQAAYAAAKAGVIGFTKTVAKEVAPFGITANVVSPNAWTRMVDSIPDERRIEIEKTVPIGRFGDPAEIGHGVLFLASEESQYVTGAVLRIDGGLAM